MGLTIGFANKYYTLWDVSEPKRVDYDTYITTVIQYTYIQNLSFDFEKAKKKVEERLGNDKYDIDLELRGSRSFEKELKKEYNPGVVLFGQFRGKTFEDFLSECDDEGYILWYYNSVKDNDKKFDPQLEELLINRGLIFKLSDGTTFDRDGLDRYLKDVFTKEIYELGHWEDEGERITKELTARSMWSYESTFGYVEVLEMVDSSGRLYYVRGSLKGIERVSEGDVVVITGTVAHKQWFDRKLGKDRQETQLKRPTLNQVFS